MDYLNDLRQNSKHCVPVSDVLKFLQNRRCTSNEREKNIMSLDSGIYPV